MLEKGGDQLRDILERAVGPDKVDICFDAIQAVPSVSVRLNPSKVQDPGTFVRDSFGDGCEPVPWSPFGFFLPERPQFTLDPLFHCGCYYVQDSSAMAVGHAFRTVLERFDAGETPVRVLDLCAAPGGKTTDLAASLRMKFGDGFVLVANEVMKDRAAVLADNVSVWGDPNVIVTSSDPKAFASLEGFFDIIVADVPCSGEGMFRKDDVALADWSEDAVRLCAGRQRRIMADVWPALRPGGTVVYSTCTFEDSENDSNVGWISEELGGCVLPFDWTGWDGIVTTRHGALFVPGLVRGEGQYVSAVVKTGGEVGFRHRTAGKDVPAFVRKKGDLLVEVGAAVAAEARALECLHPLLCGVAQGTMKGKDLVPSADLALSLSLEDGRYPRAELDRETALKYLHRDTIVLPDAPKGFLVVCYHGHPLGFVKNLETRCNNLHPNGRRIRMNI